MLNTDLDLIREPIPNMDKLDGIIDHIEAHPEQWDQGSWAVETACGTAYCVAGFACEQSEALVVDVRQEVVYAPLGHPVAKDYGESRHRPGYVSVLWPRAGAYELGLTDDEAHSLFNGGNDLTDIKVAAEKIRYRAREQAKAFERVARELIASVPELADVLDPTHLSHKGQEAIEMALARVGGDG